MRHWRAYVAGIFTGMLGSVAVRVFFEWMDELRRQPFFDPGPLYDDEWGADPSKSSISGA